MKTPDRQSGRKDEATGVREQQGNHDHDKDRPPDDPEHFASIHADARASTPATWDRAGATWDAPGRTWDELLLTTPPMLPAQFTLSPLGPMLGGKDYA